MSHGRRHFLAALGLSAGSLFLPSLGRPVHASGAQPPRRLIVLCTQHGTWHDGWAMNPAGLPADRAWVHELADTAAGEFSPALAPLWPFRERLAVVEGLAMVSGDADPAGVLRHEIGQAQALTGAMVDLVGGLPLASAPSIDQRVADHIARDDRLRSIELGVGDPPFSINYRRARQPLPFEQRPRVVFERLFGLVNGGSGASGVLGEQGSLLDRTAQRYEALASRLSGEDGQKLELHRDLVREVERRVQGLRAISCPGVDPPRPLGEGSEDDEEYEGDYDEDYRAMVQMLVSAMACDILRVATVHLGDIPAARLGQPGVTIHDDHAHNVWNDTASAQVMTDWSAYHAAQLAELLGALDAVPEGDGTMLDHTLILWTSELGDGAHGLKHLPVVLAGSRALCAGRYLHYPSDGPFIHWRWDGIKTPGGGVPHQRLLTSVARAFGLTDADGDPLDAMPVATVASNLDDSIIDCTGVLEALFA